VIPPVDMPNVLRTNAGTVNAGVARFTQSNFRSLDCERNYFLLYVFFWVIPRRLNSDPVKLPRRKHTTYRTRRKLEIKK